MEVIEDISDRETVISLLLSDPRPSYQNDVGRVYTMDYYKYKVSFRVEGDALSVLEISENDGGDDVYEYMRMRGR